MKQTTDAEPRLLPLAVAMCRVRLSHRFAANDARFEKTIVELPRGATASSPNTLGITAFSPTYQSANDQLTARPGFTYEYDANLNLSKRTEPSTIWKWPTTTPSSLGWRGCWGTTRAITRRRA